MRGNRYSVQGQDMENELLPFAVGLLIGVGIVAVVAVAVIRFIAVNATAPVPTFARTFFAAAHLLDHWSTDDKQNIIHVDNLRAAVASEVNGNQNLDLDRALAAEPRLRAALELVVDYLQTSNAYPYSDSALIALIANLLEETK